MSSIDERVVEMKFENSNFQNKAQQSIDALRSLKNNLKLDGASRGIDDVSRGMRSMQSQTDGLSGAVGGMRQGLADAAGGMSNLGGQTGFVAAQFSALQAVAFGALASIGAQAMATSQHLVSGLSVGPISEGLSDYHAKLTSVQTIMNTTGESIEVVDGYFRQLDEYADKTIYSWTDLTSAFAKCTNAGVAMETAVPAIQGISNMVALAGQGASSASIAYYNLSQAIATGYLTRMDFKSLELANVATKEWKNQMIEAAVVAGELTRKADGTFAIVASGSDKAYTSAQLFIDGLQEGWATTDVMLRVFGDYADVTTEVGRKAMAAAQDVKSFPMMMETLKAAVGTGWTDTFELLLGNVNEAKELFTGLTLAIGGFLDKIGDSRNEMLQVWKDSGGRTALIEGLTTAFQALGSILAPIGRAFRDIFPKTTAVDLLNITEAFRDWAQTLRPSAEAMRNIRETARGFFAVLDIGWELIKATVGFLRDMFNVMFQGSSNILGITSDVGNFLVMLRDVIVEGKVFQRVFGFIGDVLTPIIGFIRGIITALGDFLGVGSDSTDLMAEFSAAGENMAQIADEARVAWEKFLAYLNVIGERLRPIGEGIMEFFQDTLDAIAGFLQGLSFEEVISGVGVGAFAVIANAIRKFLAGFSLEALLGSGEQPGWIQRISDALDELTDSLQGMQNALNGAALLAIAVAIGVIALALIGLAGIPHDDLVASVIIVSLLMAALAGIAKFMSNMEIQNTGNMIAAAAALILIASAVKQLAEAVTILSDADPKGLARGLASVVSLLVIVIGMSKYFKPGETVGMITAASAMIILAAAIRILVISVERLQELNWESLAQGFTGVAALLAALGLFTRFSRVNNMGIRSGIGLILLASSILILGEALEKIQELDWHQLARGMAGFAVALALMVGALYVMSKSAPVKVSEVLSFILIATSMLILGEALEKLAELDWIELGNSIGTMGVSLAIFTAIMERLPKGATFSGVALILAATSILIIGEALEKLGAMSWSDIAAALVQVAVVMGIIGLFMTFAATGLGAAAMLALGVSLVLIAGAILVFSFALERMGSMSWSDIGAALGQLALLFVVLALGGALSPLILLLAVALGALGVGLLAIAGAIFVAGAGIDSFADALTKLSEIDQEGLDRIIANLQAMIDLLPEIATATADAIANFVTTMAERTPEMASAVGEAVSAMATEAAERAPEVVGAFLDMITGTLTAIGERMPDLIVAGADLVVKFLQGIANNAGRIITAGTDVVIAFMRGISSNAPRLAEEGMRMIIKFLTSLEISIRNNSGRIVAAAKGVGSALIDGITQGLWGGESKVSTAARGVASTALTSARNVLGVKSPSTKFREIGEFVNQGFIKGLRGGRKDVEKSINDMFGKLNDIQAENTKRANDARYALSKLYQARKLDYLAIQKQHEILNRANYELERANRAEMVLTNNLKWARHEQVRLAQASEDTAKKLDDANKKLEDAKKLRDDYRESIRNDYADLPDFTGQTNLAKYMADFERQITDTQKYATALQELRKRGLNDTMYKELVAKGPEAMPFVQQLLEQGTEGVKKLNTLGSELDKQAASIANLASAALYDAGVKAAQGLVDGLNKQQAAIQQKMATIANIIVKEIKKQLHIKSPSRVMEAIGKEVTAGLAIGIGGSTTDVERATDKVSKSAIDSMRKTLAGLGDAISGEMDVTPTIAPVLDLTAVQKDASLLNSMLAVSPIDIQGQVSRAKDAAAGLRENQLALEDLTAIGAGDILQFTQNNYSPKALSSADIYRQTNNQLSRAKGALAT